MNRDLRVLLLTKSDTDDPRCERALEFCRSVFANVQVERGAWGDPLPEKVADFDGDYLLSYMSRWIVPSSLLQRVKKASINFHPASPEYPGVGCTNFALYDGVKEYGVTCHHMSARVDTGSIISVERFPVYEWDDVASLLNRTYDHLLTMFYDIVDRIARGEPLPASRERWTREPFRRGELNSLCRVTPDMPEDEVRRRVRATTFGNWRPTVQVAGYTFTLDSTAAPVCSTRSVPMRHDRHSAELGGNGSEDGFGILLSAAGRRVSLLRLLRSSAERLGLRGSVLATDVTRMSAAFHEADCREVVHRYRDERCLPQLLELCERHRIRLIIPTIDPDLPFYSEHREAFESIGTRIMVSSRETVQICNDKVRTHNWLVQNGIPTVCQTNAEQLLKGMGAWSFPVFVKPRGGSSSLGAMTIHNADELRMATRAGDFIAQTVARGREYTVDVFVDKEGRCRCAVPRLRIETRGGEVVKGMTLRCPVVEEVSRQIAEKLPGAAGVMNIQVFFDEASGELAVSEINPRFGGGYPLSHRAGAWMTQWAMEEALGREVSATPDCWQAGLVMLRYDEAVFIDRSEVEEMVWTAVAERASAEFAKAG